MANRRGKKPKKKKRRIVPEVSPVTGKKKSRKYTAKLLPEDFLFSKRETAFAITTVLALTTSLGTTLFISAKLGLIGLACGLIVGTLGFSELRKDLTMPIWVIIFEAAVAISMFSFIWYSKEIGALVALVITLIGCGLFVFYIIYYRKEEHREKFRERLAKWEEKYYAKERRKIERRQRRKRANT